MTQAEWLGLTSPRGLFGALADCNNRRKQRLFGCACCRTVWPLLTDVCRAAVEAVERYADGAATDDELFALFEPFSRPHANLSEPGGVQAAEAVGILGNGWRWRRPEGTASASAYYSHYDVER